MLGRLPAVTARICLVILAAACAVEAERQKEIPRTVSPASPASPDPRLTEGCELAQVDLVALTQHWTCFSGSTPKTIDSVIVPCPHTLNLPDGKQLRTCIELEALPPQHWFRCDERHAPAGQWRWLETLNDQVTECQDRFSWFGGVELVARDVR